MATRSTDAFQADRYWEDRFAAHYDERGVGDIGLSRAYNRCLYKVRRQVFRRVVAMLPVSPASAQVLDIGSGTGVYVEEWQRCGTANITGSDITERAVTELSRRFSDVRFLRLDIGDVAPLSRGDGPFDIVSALDVLFHIVDDERYDRAIANIAAALRPGGSFIYSDNLVEQPSGTTHYVSRGESLILETLRRYDLRVIRRIPMFVLMNDPVRTRRRLLRRLFAAVYRGASGSEWRGRLIGCCLLPLELLATRLVSNGPSTEILICQKS